MNKKEFLSSLNKKLSKFSKQEVKERLVFYSEMIDDRVEEGLSEEEAVLEIGDIDKVAEQISLEISSDTTIKENKLTKSELILLLVGSPIWFPLLLTAFIVIWALLLSMWAIELPFLIFSYISKCFIVACKASTKWVVNASKVTFKRLGDVFNR